MLGMQAMQLLTTAEACHYLLATRKEESMEDFEDPVFFGYIDASGDDDRYVSKEGDVHVRTDFDEAIDMPQNSYNDLEKVIFGVATVELTEKPVFSQSQYLTCEEFSQMYAHLLGTDQPGQPARSKSDIEDLIDEAISLREQQGFDVPHCVTQKSWWQKYSKLPAQQLKQTEDKYHIDGGFLYYDDAARGFRLCVPSGHAPKVEIDTSNDDPENGSSSANNGSEHKRDNQHDGHDHGDDA